MCPDSFLPYVVRDEEGRLWHVVLANEADYVLPDTPLRADLHVSLETGKVVGLTLHDANLPIACGPGLSPAAPPRYPP